MPHIQRPSIHSDARSIHLVILPPPIPIPSMAPKKHSPPRPPRKPRPLRPISDWAPSREDVANAIRQNSSPRRPLSSDPVILHSASAALPGPSLSSTRPPAPPRPKPSTSRAPKPGPSLKRKLPPAQRFVFLDGPPSPAPSGSRSGACPPPPRSKPRPPSVQVVDLTRSPSPPLTIPSSDSSPLFEIPTVFQQLRRARKRPPVAEPSAPQFEIPPGFHQPKRPRKLPPTAERAASSTENRSGSASQQQPKRPEKHPRPAEHSSPTIAIPTVFQELRRARKLQRTGEADARPSILPSSTRARGSSPRPPSQRVVAVPASPPPAAPPPPRPIAGPSRLARRTQERGPERPSLTRPSSQRVATVLASPSPPAPPSPRPIAGPSRLARRIRAREPSPAPIVSASSPPLELDPLATPRARPPALSAATSHPQNFPGPIEPGSADDSFRTPKAARHQRLVSDSPRVAASESTASSAAEAEHVASVLLGRPPVLSAAPLPSPGPPPPRFLSADLKLLPVYLLKPVSALSTSCASLVVPPEPVPGLPADPLPDERWLVRRESISGQGAGQKINCWALGPMGWPARLFTVCGWLVGIDRRERHLTYYIDDGTAVLECQLPIPRLVKIFEPVSSQEASKSDVPKTQGAGSKAASPNKRPRSDPRLDAYRRLSPSRRAVRPTAPSGGSLGRVGTADAAPVSEATIEHYASLALGLTLKLTGPPRDMFGGKKRVLDVEWARMVGDVAEEIGFRTELRALRRDMYSRPFRLANVWSDAQRAVGAHASPAGIRQGAGHEEQTVKPARRLRLPPVRSISASQVTFAKFLSYVTHHILTTYSHASAPVAIRPGDILRDPELRAFAARLSALDGDGSGAHTRMRSGGSVGSQEGVFLGSGMTVGRTGTEQLVSRAIRTLVHQGTLIISPLDESVCALPNVHTLGPVLVRMLVDGGKHLPSTTTEEIIKRLRRDELWRFVQENCVVEVLEQICDFNEKMEWVLLKKP